MLIALLVTLHLALVLGAALNIAQTASRKRIKLVWLTFILLFPVLGLIAWFFNGPRNRLRR